MLGEIDQVTAVFVVLPTVAVNACEDEGQLSAVSLGHRLTVAGLTETLTGLLLLPPQAIMNPRTTSEKHKRAIAERFDTFLPTKPSITTPAMGSVSGSHGERLAARWRNDPFPVLFGPTVVMVIETGVAPAVPAGIVVGVKAQLLGVSVVSVGAKAQAKVTALAKVDDEVGVAVKV